MTEKRDHRIHIRVSEDEKKQLEAASSQFGTKSLSAYVRKMVIDGPIINLQIPELSEVVSQLRENNEHINQIAARVNSTGRIYASDLDQIAQDQQKVLKMMNYISEKLSYTGKGTFTVRNGVFTPVLERRRGTIDQGSDGVGAENESGQKRCRRDCKCRIDILLMRWGTVSGASSI